VETFPSDISLHESFASSTIMFLRNQMSMDTEEMIRAQLVDACVIIGGMSRHGILGLKEERTHHAAGRDKTAPAQLMGGLSANKPVLPLVTGPVMSESYKGA
jgi:dihydroxy-acid dehydratase